MEIPFASRNGVVAAAKGKRKSQNDVAEAAKERKWLLGGNKRRVGRHWTAVPMKDDVADGGESEFKGL